jgi:hypothetical protein
MPPFASDPREDAERRAARAFQSEDGEHAAPVTPSPVPPIASGPAAAYQHEDDELVWPID